LRCGVVGGVCPQEFDRILSAGEIASGSGDVDAGSAPKIGEK
jgi:hypothetical protein